MRVLVAINAYNEEARSTSFILRSFFDSLGIESDQVYSPDLVAGAKLGDLVSGMSPRDYELAVVLGGDGTILRVAHLFAGCALPILGINFGNFGFLANSSEPGVMRIVEETLAGNVVIEQRTNLSIDVYCDAEYARQEEGWKAVPKRSASDVLACDVPATSTRTLFALNEVSLHRGASGTIFEFGLMVAGDEIASIRSDGIIVASATGSTGYALSAGGPVVAPGHRGLVVTPIAPHTLRSRAIVTGPGDVVEIAVAPSRDGAGCTLCIDGEVIPFEEPVSRIVARPGEVPTSLVRYGDKGFYRHVSESFF